MRISDWSSDVCSSDLEDAALAILERTTVSADHRLARAVAEAWIDAGLTGTAAENLLRRNMVLFRVPAALIEAAALDVVELTNPVNEAVVHARSGVVAFGMASFPRP